MKKDLKLRIKSGALALIVAGGIGISTLPKTKAEDIQITVKHGSFIENNEDENYIRYVVKKGDCSSIISKKICRYFGIQETTKYWPVIAFLNDYPRIIQPGDIIKFPSSIKEMDKLLDEIKRNNYTSLYIQKYHIYDEKENESIGTLNELLVDIYGDVVYEDQSFIDNYLKTIGLRRKYNGSSVITDTNQLFELTEWIPTLEELGYQKTR